MRSNWPLAAPSTSWLRRAQRRISHIPWALETADRALPNPLVSLLLSFFFLLVLVPFSPFCLSYIPLRAKSLRRKAQREYSQRLSMGTLDPCRQPRETKPQVLPWRHADVVAKEARKRQEMEGQRERSEAYLETMECVYVHICIVVEMYIIIGVGIKTAEEPTKCWKNERIKPVLKYT